MTTTTIVTVSYERKLSDGNYGSEGLSIQLAVPFDADPGDDALDAIAQRLRVFILTELSRSAAPRVASAADYELNPPRRDAKPVAGAPEYEESPF